MALCQWFSFFFRAIINKKETRFCLYNLLLAYRHLYRYLLHNAMVVFIAWLSSHPDNVGSCSSILSCYNPKLDQYLRGSAWAAWNRSISSSGLNIAPPGWLMPTQNTGMKAEQRDTIDDRRLTYRTNLVIIISFYSSYFWTVLTSFIKSSIKSCY